VFAPRTQVLNSILFSCLRVGYTPWSLIDFAESKGFRLKQPKQAQAAAQAGPNTVDEQGDGGGEVEVCEAPPRSAVTLPGRARRGHHVPPPPEFDVQHHRRRRRPALSGRVRPTLFDVHGSAADVEAHGVHQGMMHNRDPSSGPQLLQHQA
jgi:hypothetical protein